MIHLDHRINTKQLSAALKKRARRINLPMTVITGFVFKKRVERPVSHLVFIAADFERVVGEALQEVTGQAQTGTTIAELMKSFAHSQGVEMPGGDNTATATTTTATAAQNAPANGDHSLPEQYKLPLHQMGFPMRDLEAIRLPANVTEEEEVFRYCLQQLGRI